MAKSKEEKNMKVRSVAFNLDDPDQKKMFDFASERTNFSAYVKRLIQRDMEGGVGMAHSHDQRQEEPKSEREKPIEIDEDIAKGMI